MRQVVAADRESIEALCEGFRQNHVRGNLAHHIDPKTILSALQTIRRHDFEHAVGLLGRTAKGNHDDDIIETDGFPQAADGAAFERKPLTVARRVIAGGAAKAQHRIFLLWFEAEAADQIGVFIGLEVAHAHDDGRWMMCSGDMGERLGEPVDEIFGLVVVSVRQLRDGRAWRSSSFSVSIVHKRHRMDLDVVADDELHAR